jgi:hypothetical protein
MAASTVTGIGKGAAYGQKGPENLRDQFVPLSGPHAVAAGVIASADARWAANVYTVTFPEVLALGKANYAVLATTDTAGVVTTVTTKTDTNGKFASFAITRAGAASVDWVVIQTGWGLDIAKGVNP